MSRLGTFKKEELEESESDRKASAKDYLNQVMGRLEPDGTKLTSEVLIGMAAESLADYLKKNDFDLMIIATHGRSGISRWVLGSTVQPTRVNPRAACSVSYRSISNADGDRGSLC